MGKITIQLDVINHDSGNKTYVGEMRHEGLGKHRTIRDTSENEEFVRVLTKLQWADWQQRFEDAEQERLDIERRFPDKWMTDDRRRDKADALTRAIQNDLKRLESILACALTVSHAIDWEGLKGKFLPFDEKPPIAPPQPGQPGGANLPMKPTQDQWNFQPSISMMDKLIPSRKRQRIEEAQRRYEEAVALWQEAVDQINATVLRNQYAHAELTKEWEARKAEFRKQESLRNAAIDAKQAAYLASDPDAIVTYSELVLSCSNYPNFFPHEWEIEYEQSSKQLIVDYLLPAPDDFPKLKGIKWVATRGAFEEQKLTDSARTKLYDDVIYQIVLRTAQELFDADIAGAIDAIVVNGIVNSIDRGTGKKVTACILSLRAEAAVFKEINLSQVDPKTCFKSLKGVGSSKLHGLSPIPPIMPLRKDDARFVAAYGVADTLDSGVNLAAMGWEDFEHLIREIFEKEFSATGGEVRVTQASRDGGVDAIVFDPDPIRGGKIVIQAKRYTNTVGVSAVRDLYGTVLNEGATKGILVTTSDYGTDSYNFAQGKPLVLLSGANLLHMLEKHGHKAKIDIKEAKKMLADEEISRRC